MAGEPSIPDRVWAQVTREAKYAPYLARQNADVEALRTAESVSLPDELDYGAMPGLSAELRSKLIAARPETIGQAERIEGMTPAALTLLLYHARRRSAA